MKTVTFSENKKLFREAAILKNRLKRSFMQKHITYREITKQRNQIHHKIRENQIFDILK